MPVPGVAERCVDLASRDAPIVAGSAVGSIGKSPVVSGEQSCRVS